MGENCVFLYNPTDVFGEEIAHISSSHMRHFVYACLLTAPAYFWQAPASSSGKNHPWWARTEGGLVRHTKAAVWVGLELLEAYPHYGRGERDALIVALLLHDTLKNYPQRECYKNAGRKKDIDVE